MAEVPQVINSMETARAAVRGWGSKFDRMDRLGELAMLVGRCRTEEHLGFLVSALSEFLGQRPELRTKARGEDSPAGLEMKFEPLELAAPASSAGPGRKAVEMISKPLPKPAPPVAPVEFKPEEIQDPLELEPLVEAKAPEPQKPKELPPVKPDEVDILRPSKPRETPFTKIVKGGAAPAAPPPAVFTEMEAPPEAKPAEPQKPPETRRTERLSEPLPAADFSTIPPPLAPSPEALPKIDPARLPPGVDPEVLADILRVEQCRKVFATTHQEIETWEVFSLVMIEGDRTRTELERLLALRSGGDMNAFTEGAMTLFDSLLKLRAKYGKFIRDVRAFVSTLPVGRFGKETMEMSLGFLIVSGRGREAATRWMTDPKRYQQEAAGRWEALISTTMRYQTAVVQLRT